MIYITSKKPVVKLIGIEFFEDSEHAKIDGVPTRHRLSDEIYSKLRGQRLYFGVNYIGMVFSSFSSCLDYFNREKHRIEGALEKNLGEVRVRVPTEIPEILRYTGLDGYLRGESLDGMVFDLPHELDTNKPYYGGAFTGKNGPLVAVPIVLFHNEGEGVIGKVGLVDVIAVE